MKTVTKTSAGGVVVDDEGRLVLTARRSFKGELQWGLPKGIVEEGETPQQAAIREASEETGLEVEIISPIERIDYWFFQPGGDFGERMRIHKFVHFFLMRSIGGDPTAHDGETEEVVFLEPPVALRRASFPSEKRVIQKAAALVSRPAQS